MAEIHAQTGEAVQPIATLGEEIGEKGQETLRQVSQQVKRQTQVRNLKRWSSDWRVVSALALGVLAGLWLYSRSDRD